VDLIKVSASGGVLTITLDDVGRRNVLSRHMVLELLAAIDDAEKDSSVRVVVVTNEGTVFCAGADLAEASRGNSGQPSGSGADLSELLFRIVSSPKPFVGRLNGHCVAGGLGLAAAMDFSVAVSHAKFGFSEVRIGVAPAIISVVCLPKMRLADAKAAFLRGDRFLADEAVRIGLVNVAVAPDQLDSEVASVVNDFLAGEPSAMAVAKGLATPLSGPELREAFTKMAQLSADMFASEGAREGMAAFLEKRPASWVPHVTVDESE